MCGIVGIFAFNNTEEKKQAKKREAMTFLFTELLQETQIRGKDATGVSALFDDGHFIIQKGGVPASDFISNYGDSNNNYNTFVETCRTYKDHLKLLVGHCRKSSVGNSFNNSNNHPIRAGEIIGVHNGTLTNHEKIFKKLGCDRDGTVDSEAIMRLLQVYTKDCTEPFTVEMLTEVSCKLDGAFSVIAYNANNPYQVALLRKQRPLEILLIKSLKLMVIVSEKVFFDTAVHQFNKYARLYKSGFSLIEKKDIESVALPLDNVAVVNLTKTMTDTTKVDDLIEKFDFFKSPKHWQSAVTNYNYNTAKKNENVAKSGNNLPTLPQTTGTTVVTRPNTQQTNSTFAGKIYSKELGRYVDAAEANKLATVQATIFTNNSIKKDELGNKQVEVPTDSFKDVVGLTVVTKEKPVDIDISGVKELKQEPIKAELVSQSTAIVDDEKTSEYDKLAQLAALGVRKFSTEEEVVKYLQAESSLNLKALPLSALANRIINKVYANAYLDGLSAGLALNEPSSEQKDATKSVRLSKHVIRMFGRFMHLVCPSRSLMSAQMETVFNELNISELTKENMQLLFSKGDLQSNIGLIELIKLINKKNGKDANTSTI